MRFEKDKPGKVLFKTSFYEDEFSVYDLRRKRRQSLNLPDTIPTMRRTPYPIKTSKYKNLMELLPWVPARLHDFYKKLHHSAQTEEIPEDDDESEAENDQD